MMDHNDQDILENRDAIGIRGLITKVVYHWPLFLLSLFVFVTAGFLYYRYAVRIFEIKASIVIKDDRVGSGYDVLKELDLVDNSLVRETEMELLKSKSMVGQSIHELSLYVRYFEEGRVKKSDIYDETPVLFTIISGESRFYNTEIQVRVVDDNKYVVQFGDGEEREVTLNQEMSLKNSKWMLIKNPRQRRPFTGQRIMIRVSDPSEVTAYFQSKLDVAFTNKAKAVIGLTIKDVNPDRGVDFLNKLIEVYNTASVNDKNQVAKNTMAFLDERLGYLTRELSLIEKELEDYKSSRKITNISSESQLFLETAREKDTQISQVSFKLELLNQISRYVKSSSVTEPMPAIFGIDDAVLQSQLSSFNLLLSDRERMMATAGPQSPLLQIKEQQIQSARKAIEDNLSSLNKVFEASLKELQTQSSMIENSIRMIPTIEREFISIKRQQTIKEELYLFLLQKREEAGLTYASAVPDSRMVDTAFASPEPVSPKISLIIQFSLLLGIGLPFIYIYLKDILNNKIIAITDIRQLSSIPFLGEIATKSTESNIVVSEKSRGMVAEQFRAIRTNLHYIHGRQLERGRVTLVTSSISGEGKTFFAVNLALSLALAGRKVVLIELDLRKPKISRYLDIHVGDGVTQYLAGIAKEDQIVHQSGLHENLDVIASGPLPPNPSEILMGQMLDKLTESLRNKYDDIVIDTAPIGLVADAQIIARQATASIFLIRHGYSLKSQVHNIESIYKENKLPGMGIVFNGVDRGGKFGYGYSNGYGYGYGKEYGYYDDQKGNQKNLSGKFAELIKRI